MIEQINSNKRAAFNHQRDYCPKALYRKKSIPLLAFNIFVLKFPSIRN